MTSESIHDAVVAARIARCEMDAVCRQGGMTISEYNAVRRLQSAIAGFLKEVDG